MTTIETRRAPGVSRRAHEMPASPIRRLAPLADAAKARGTRVLHLNIGQPDIETPACIRDRLAQLDSKVLEYSPSTGTPEFLRSLQRYYERRLGLKLEPNQILATTHKLEKRLEVEVPRQDTTAVIEMVKRGLKTNPVKPADVPAFSAIADQFAAGIPGSRVPPEILAAARKARDDYRKRSGGH